MSLRVVITNSFFPPWRGGAETYVYYLASNLVQRGHNVTVICASDPLQSGTRTENGIEVHRLRTSFRFYGTPILLLLGPELAKAKADIVHANFPNPYNAFLSAMVSKKRQLPAVLSWHNDLPPVSPTASVFVAAHDKLVPPAYLPAYSKIIAGSQIYANTSPTLLRFPERVTIIPYGVDCEKFNPHVEGSTVRNQFKLGDAHVLLFVAALTKWHKYKGLDILLHALVHILPRSPQVRLLVLGTGELLEQYRSLAVKLGVQNHVIFAGDGGPWHVQLPAFYAASDLLVLPSKDRSEGFGLVVLEANASGKPVIGSRVGGIPAAIRDGYNGFLVDPNSPRKLANAILSLLDNETMRKSMAANAREHAERHDWKIVTSLTEKLYEQVLRER